MSESGRPSRAQVVAKVAANIRSALAWRDLKPKALEHPLGLSYSGVSRRMAGTVAFDVGEIAEVARLVGLPMSALIEGGPPWDGGAADA